ncbi:MAG: DUF3536 domain-containing protein [Spirochaetales bacterium]|nr:DUF3536 domain-containing protein [Spirochaetales bacterium]
MTKLIDMKNTIVIHGHFYQPPREDPWLGLIPYQESAYPYHDWNQKITKECYAANTMSRVLDSSGRISDLVNNYEYISFNFGPTLLSWLKENHAEVYERILQADRKSIEKNGGHGNALAQCYNHTILPLAAPEDARMQIIWGIRDFETHFQRKPEGMWLAETAINDNVADILIECGINFVVLSPWQADAICPVGSEKWQTYKHNPVPSGRAYRIERDNGNLNVFFYNHILAHGISFEHYLRNADSLYEKFISFRQTADKTYLLNVATDGEVYGHHEPFGDMCLAAFSKIVEERNEFTFTNYGHYLELFPPTYRVRLKKGENGKGTSWSCVHGIARWHRDCGCSTGGQKGWNQEWRTPLRNAFDFLRDNLNDIYLKEMAKLSSKDPYLIRDMYIEVLTGQKDRKDMVREMADRTDTENSETFRKFYSLLEGQKYIQFMFTSCGWFFSEISGLETTQNMKYAIKALDIYAEWKTENILPTFLSELENARSNISSFGSGRNIIETWIIPEKKGNEYGASIFVLSELCMGNGSHDDLFGIYRKDEFILDSEKEEDLCITKEGRITVTDVTRCKTDTYSFSFQEKDLEGFFLTIKKAEPGEDRPETLNISIGSLPLELRTKISGIISQKVVDKCISCGTKAFNHTINALAYIKRLNVTGSPTMRELAELLINRNFEAILTDTRLTVTEENLAKIKELVTVALEYKLNVNTDGVRRKISRILEHQAKKLTSAVQEEPVKAIIHLLETARSLKIEPDITGIQEIVFYLLKSFSDYSMEEIEEHRDFNKLNRMRRLIKLGTVLGLNVESLKENFFSL